MLTRNRIIIAGSGRLARILAVGMKTAGRPADLVDRPEGAGSHLRSARTLVIAGEVVDTAGIADLCRRRPSKQPLLRVIVVQDQARQTPLPTPPQGARVALELFDVRKQAARALLARWPLHAGMDPLFGQTLHLLIAGPAPPARALLVQALRLAHYGDRQPVFTIAGERPEMEREAFRADYPQAEHFCRLRFTDLKDPELAEQPPVTGVYVCLSPAERGLEAAQRLAQQIADEQGASPLIHLEIGEAQPEGSIDDWDGQILPFSYLREACRPQVLLDGRGDELARVIHEHYGDSIAAQGRDPTAEPAGQPWETLAASYRDASRHQADHLWAKLAVTDCRAVPEELVESFAFAPLEVERLAVIEHQRWAADRYLDGWTYAPERDNARKHHPQLIPYDDLSVPMKDLDRFAVRLIPTLLARSGRGVVRMLLVGVRDAEGGCPTGSRLLRLADQALERLVRRYPDRSLVLVSTLTDEASRLVVRRAVERHRAVLFLLCSNPFGETLTAQPDERSKRDLLEVAARAERRIALTGTETLEEWLSARTDIIMLIGTAARLAKPDKQLRIDPAGGGLQWSFEY